MTEIRRDKKIAKVKDRCNEVFGNSQATEDWLNSEVVALGGKTPLELMETDAGIDMVLLELGRIKHGIVS